MCSHTSSVRWCWVVYWRDIKLLCLEKISNEAFQSLWIEISFIKEKSVIFGIVYRQHNSPKRFQQYLDETIEKFAPSGKHVVIMGDFRIDPLQCDSSSYSHNLMSSLQSCYLILTIDKPEFIALLLLSSMISLLAILTKLWLARKSRKSKSITFIKDPSDSDKFTRDPISIANVLNKHLACVGPTIANNLPPAKRHSADFLKRTESTDSSVLLT